MGGTIIGIFTASAEGAPVVSRDEVQAVAGRGLEGDRYFDSNAGQHEPEDEITLITAEGLAAAEAEHGLGLAPGEHRRNIVVEGVDLLALVGRTVQVGGAEVEVIADNPSCKYLQELTGKPVLRALRHTGGVRGAIVTGGLVRVGDPVDT
jgi:MOSC domain-containing protein YiiM